MKKLLLVSLCFLWLGIAQVFAQSRTVTGTVIAKEDGGPIPGVSVKVKGTSLGVITGADGKFSINVPESGKVLVFGFIGYGTIEKPITGSVVNATLEVSSHQLGEVVVNTALGIQSKADNLNYSQQGLKGSDLTSTRITDINTAMAGKIANVQVKTQSAAKLGSQSAIRIRGGNSVSSLSNDPLYVVDNTPIDDINFINMDDVDDIQVLKGPAAAALYGQRGANGVIIVTTKKAKAGRFDLTLTSTLSADNVANLPHFQNEYAGGSAGSPVFQTYTWAAGDPVEWQALNGKQYHQYFDDASWGPKMSGQEYIPWYAWFPGSQYSFKTATLNPQPNNVKDFYSTGVNAQNNLAFAKAGDGYNVRISYTNQNTTGLLPSTYLKRNYLSATTHFDFDKHFSTDINFNYVNQKYQGDFSDTYGNVTSGSFLQWFHRDLDINILKELSGLRTPYGRIPSWNLNDESGVPNKDAFYGGSDYWTNPFTYQSLASAINIQDRLYGNAGVTYKFSSHFKVNGNFSHNQRNTHYESKLPSIFGLSTQDMSSPLANNPSGGTRPVVGTYRTYDVRQVENNYSFLASYNQKISDINIDANFGGNIRRNDYSSIDNSTKGGLVVPDLFTLTNSVTTPFTFSATRYQKIVRSLYGSAAINWKDIVILNATIRNDWSSALPVSSNSYLYPSIGGSFIFTKFVEKTLPFISFGKVRASWAEVGSDVDQYQTQLYYSVLANQYNSNIAMTTPNQDVDTGLKPALSKSTEFGADIRFLSDRLGISVTYYNEDRINDIIPINISSASGFVTRLSNAGKINRHGIEATLDGYVVRNKNFNYNITLNFAHNTSRVDALIPGVDNLYLGGSDYSSSAGTASYAPGVWSSVGSNYGQIIGRGIQKINGQNVINSDGTFAYVDNVKLGSVLPDFTGGMINTFTYKNLSLNFTIDFSKGGQYFSLSNFWGGFSGLYDFTAGNNDRGKPTRDPVANGGGVHVKGVDATGKPVDMYVDATVYYDNNGLNKINETSIFDLSYVKLREINLGYRFDTKSFGSVGKYLKGLQISAFVRNPWLIYTQNKNFDPSELTGNYGESGQLPPSRTIGATLKLGF
ncbi:SusC/RagA family TonB-linked outer membrane protein [Mucilaginibacter sp. AW1-3]